MPRLDRSTRRTPVTERERRPAVAGAASVMAAVVVWSSLTLPDQLGRLTPGAALRIPVEALLLVALAPALRGVWGRVVVRVGGVVLGLVVILKIIDIAFFAVLGRGFAPRTDASYLVSAANLLRDSAGPAGTVAALVVTTLALAALVLLVTRSVRRLVTCASRHQATSTWATCLLTAVWLLCAALGVQTDGGPVAATAAEAFTSAPVEALPTGEDAFAAAPDEDLLSGLRGKDVLLVFVESYGRVAVEDPAIAPGVDAVLTRGTASLQSAGFASRSAFLTSPTYAGISWLAHSTLQSGLWIDTQQRYDQLLRTDRLTLSGAFHRAGWRTVADVPSNDADWPEGKAFYHDDAIYDRRNVGYAGPSFSYAAMPDQYTLAAFDRSELRPRHAPVMAEIDLVSSHGPWAPLPQLVPWGAVGDGSVFSPMAAQGQSPDALVGHQDKIKVAYGQAIQYSLSTLISFVETVHDDNLVVVMVGDHQPAAVVSGPGASRDVPVTILAHDAEVMGRIASWGWQPGMLPQPQAPVWRMDAFRDRFLAVYAAT